MTAKIEIHDIVCGKIKLTVDEITKLTSKEKKRFYGPKGSNCMITTNRINCVETDQTYYFSKETIKEVQAMIDKVKESSHEAL